MNALDTSQQTNPPASDSDLPRVRAGLSERARLVLAVVLACGLVVAIVVGILVSVRYLEDKDSSAGRQVDASLAEEMKKRSAVKTAAGTFVGNVNTYDSDDIDGFRSRLDGLLTPSFAKSNQLFVDSIIKTMRTTKLKSEGKVLETAVSQIDDKSATALVVADAHATSVFGERVRHFRWQVSLVRSSEQPDQWLVDDFEPVA
jgi:hypothetical protein